MLRGVSLLCDRFWSGFTWLLVAPQSPQGPPPSDPCLRTAATKVLSMKRRDLKTRNERAPMSVETAEALVHGSPTLPPGGAGGRDRGPVLGPHHPLGDLRVPLSSQPDVMPLMFLRAPHPRASTGPGARVGQLYPTGPRGRREAD